MTEDEKPRKRWWRWVVIACAILCAAAIVLLIALNIVFSVNELKPERVQPPRAMLRIKPTPRVMTGPMGVIVMAAPKGSYEAFLAASSNKTAAALYPKLADTLCATTYQNLHLFNEGTFPLSRRQTLDLIEIQWLRDNRDVIEKAIELAEAGLPTLSSGEAAALDAGELKDLPIPNMLLAQRLGSVLCAETRARRERTLPDSDDNNTARSLLAIGKLADSISEPEMLSALMSTGLRRTEYRELCMWIEQSPWQMNQEAARMLRTGIEKAKPIDLRAAAEFEYRQQRDDVVKGVTKSYRDTFKQRLGTNYNLMNGLDVWFVVDEVASGKPNGLKQYIQASIDSIRIKSMADTIVQDYDEYYKKAFARIEQPQNEKPNSNLAAEFNNASFAVLGFSIPNYDEAKNRIAVAEAQRQVALAGLDWIADATTDSTRRIDPFTGEPIRIKVDSAPAKLYSVGPDGTDQGGDVEYDPSNGTISAGDVVLRINRKKW